MLTLLLLCLLVLLLRFRFFLLVNICAVLFFIFASAWYFPPVVSDSVVRQALSQGESGHKREDLALDSSTVAPVTTTVPSIEAKSAAEVDGDGLMSEASLQDVTPAVQTHATPLEVYLEKPQRGAQDLAASPENSDASPDTAKEQESTPMVESLPETMASVVRNAVDVVATATPETVQEAEHSSADPLATKSSTEEKEPDTIIPSPKQQQPTHSSMADLVAKMKERRDIRSEVTETPVAPVKQQPVKEDPGQKSALDNRMDTKGGEHDKGEPSDAFKKLLADKIKGWTPVKEDGKVLVTRTDGVLITLSF